jgi:hypothetical protein
MTTIATASTTIIIIILNTVIVVSGMSTILYLGITAKTKKCFLTSYRWSVQWQFVQTKFVYTLIPQKVTRLQYFATWY